MSCRLNLQYARKKNTMIQANKIGNSTQLDMKEGYVIETGVFSGMSWFNETTLMEMKYE